ncbi:MAG: hypothetical protein RL660_1572 [Bacteroidota bacterium]|jgi:hypothetical protein
MRVSLIDLEAFLQNSELLIERIDKEEDLNDSPNLLYVDQAWAGINFLLTGEDIESDHELGEVMLPDLVIDEAQDLGYGPAMYLLPERVKELHEQIFNIGTKELQARYDADTMEELGIYPGNWQNDEEMFPYLSEYFEEVQGFYADAAKNKEAIIVYLT